MNKNNLDKYDLIEHAKAIGEYVVKTPRTLKAEIAARNNKTKMKKKPDKTKNEEDDDDEISTPHEKRLVHTYGWHFLSLKCSNSRVKQLIRERWPGIDCLHMEALLFNFFLRIQPSMLAIVNNMIYNSISSKIVDDNDDNNNDDDDDNSNYRLNDIVPSKTISSMIRWSDKCRNSDSKGHPEQECFLLKEYIYIARMLKSMLKNDKNNEDNDLENIIITSESKDILLNATNHTLYDPINDLYNLTMIINKNDVMQGASTVARFSSEKNPLTIILSVFSTMKLQFMGKYYFHVSTSSWVRGVYQLKKYFHCKPFYMSQIYNLINHGFVKLNRQYFINNRNNRNNINDSSLINMNDLHYYKKSLNDISKHMKNKNYEYNAQCIEFKSPAFHHNGFDRFVYFSKQLINIKNELFPNENGTEILQNMAKTKNYNMTVPTDWKRSCEW